MGPYPIDQLEPDLRKIADNNYIFQNWAKTFQCKPELYFTPSTEEQIQKIINLARSLHKPVKVIGSGHSPSDLACTNGFMISIDRLDNLLGIDKKNCRATVEAGMKLHKLHQILRENGLALSNLGSISDQTVAGVISTASHGTGANYGCLSTMIVDMTLITADGNTLFCSDTENKEIFAAARCSLGSLGIITRVTLQLEPDFKLEAIQKPYKFSDILNNWDAVIHSSEHTRIWWYPHTDDCVVWKANRTTKDISRSGPSTLIEWGWGFHAYQAMLNITRYKTSLIPYLTKLMFRTLHSYPVQIVDVSNKVFNFDCLFPQYVNEWAIDWKDAPAALRKLDTFIVENDLKVHFPVEIRFVDEDDVWLSPAYGRKTCYIGIIMYRPYHKPVPYKKYWKGYEDIMRQFKGRPHWAKAHGQTRESLETSYPKFQDFLQIRQKLDPEGMFLNDYLKRHVVISHHQEAARL
ncbi:D-arabinono-1,4-lactone oxidase-domain-containing protein [Cokeromyces recurvatus]|uniref:D-arabinono-1,4-lactone oxidase-domain-containing protein n=1 Tax=Cokeromyces recurvatus TaxID=90255 RepID=UPI00221F01EB|nr:D-arabinono-1,4-lactone oxidase-domain-containing protein [Cokeromyces recurvatus]KAI7905527.1 D-arabinono-1,4-lactone oxidase-domain-containing protein [Cokeromyces recurvatus]